MSVLCPLVSREKKLMRRRKTQTERLCACVSATELLSALECTLAGAVAAVSTLKQGAKTQRERPEKKKKQ